MTGVLGRGDEGIGHGEEVATRDGGRDWSGHKRRMLAEAQEVFHDPPEGTSTACVWDLWPPELGEHAILLSDGAQCVVTQEPRNGLGLSLPRPLEASEIPPSPCWPCSKQMVRFHLERLPLRPRGLTVWALSISPPGGKEAGPGLEGCEEGRHPNLASGTSRHCTGRAGNRRIRAHSKGRGLAREEEEKCRRCHVTDCSQKSLGLSRLLNHRITASTRGRHGLLRSEDNGEKHGDTCRCASCTCIVCASAHTCVPGTCILCKYARARVCIHVCTLVCLSVCCTDNHH